MQSAPTESTVLPETTVLDTVRTGPTLRRARELSGIPRPSAARAVGVSRRELREVERGRRPATIDLVERAVRSYGGGELVLPQREDLVHPDDPTLLVVGSDRIRVDPFRSSDRGVLLDYVAAVRRQRGIAADAEVPFRSHDLVQLAGVLDLTAADLERQLADVAGLTTSDAIRATRALVLTGLCLAVAGVAWAPEGSPAWCPSIGPDVFRVAPSPSHGPSHLFAVDPVPAPPTAVSAMGTLDHAVLGGVAIDGVTAGHGRTDPGRMAGDGRDSSWLSRGSRPPVFSVVPSSGLAALAELVGEAPAAVAPELLELPTGSA